MLCSREGTGEVVTGSDDSPYAASSTHDPLDLVLNWALLPSVPVDRASAVTPRRNPQTEAALAFAAELAAWADRVGLRIRADVLTSATVKVSPSALSLLLSHSLSLCLRRCVAVLSF